MSLPSPSERLTWHIYMLMKQISSERPCGEDEEASMLFEKNVKDMSEKMCSPLRSTLTLFPNKHNTIVMWWLNVGP